MFYDKQKLSALMLQVSTALKPKVPKFVPMKADGTEGAGVWTFGRLR